MKLLLFIIGFILSHISFGQKEKEQLYFRVFCGGGAQTSKEIKSFKLISSLKDSVEIKTKLLEGSDLEQILSAIILTYYYSNGTLKLSHPLREKINNLSKSRRKFILCYTCTYHEEGTLKKLFKKKTAAFIIIKGYLLGEFPLSAVGLR